MDDQIPMASTHKLLEEKKLQDKAHQMRGLNRDERSNDLSGTPHGLITQAAKQRNLALIVRLTPEIEVNVRVEYPCGPEFRRQRGYARFIEFKEPVTWLGTSCRYALIEDDTPIRLDHVPQAEICPSCERRGAIEFGLCAICGARRGKIPTERPALHTP